MRNAVAASIAYMVAVPGSSLLIPNARIIAAASVYADSLGSIGCLFLFKDIMAWLKVV